MKEISTFCTVMSICLLGTLAIIIAPLLVHWKMVDSASSPPVLIALKSTEYQTSLIVSLSISTPMFLELLLRIFMNAKVEFVLPNAIILTALAIPDLIILTYVRIFLDLNALNYLLKARLLLFMWLACTFIKKCGGSRWSYYGLLMSFTFLCVGRILSFYKGYFSQEVHDVLNILGSISDLQAFVTFMFMSVRWFHFIYKEIKNNSMTNHQYLCNLYVTAVLITCSGLYINMNTSPDAVDWYNWDTNELIFSTLMFTIFYVIVILFEGRALQREMLQTKVCNQSYHHLLLNIKLI